MSDFDAGRDAANVTTPGAAKADQSPFMTGSGGRLATMVRFAAYATLIVAAGGFTWYATRGESEPQAASGHQHGATASTESASPVHVDPDAARRIGLTFATASAGPIVAEVRTVGQVTYDETRVKAIAPKIAGWVDQLYVDFNGREVRQGEPLLSIYSPMLVAAQEELLLALRLARDVENGTEDAKRSAADLVASARRRLAYWDIPAEEIATLERTGTVTKTLTLRSPVQGVVVEKAVLAGQQIMEGQSLFQVADLSRVWVEGEIFERDLSFVRMGARVAVELDAYPGEPRSGSVTYVYPTVDPATRTTRIRVELPNPGLRLRPGMYATIRVPGAARTNVVSVPRTAVLATGKRVIAFVRMPDGMLEPREVVLGMTSDDRVEVVSGLKEGDVVVSSATFLVDAESNLGEAMGAMMNMPGMSDTPGPGPQAPGTEPQTPGAAPQAPGPEPQTPVPEMDHANMPGMTMPPAKKLDTTAKPPQYEHEE